MVKRHSLADEQSLSYKIEHNDAVFEHIKRSGALLLGALKTLEIELQSRQLITGYDGSFYPLWFLAETERNIFLWRKGCSLIEKDDFDFWVDIKGLIKKRLSALERAEISNPFFSPRSAMHAWDNNENKDSLINKESNYLCMFQEIFLKIEDYANALSVVSKECSDEFRSSRMNVLLPALKSTQ